MQYLLQLSIMFVTNKLNYTSARFSHFRMHLMLYKSAALQILVTYSELFIRLSFFSVEVVAVETQYLENGKYFARIDISS